LNTVDPKHKRRSYAARAYYEPNAERTNLSLLTNALVAKILLEKNGGDAKATGVQFIVDDATHTVKVKKEVIVCGGVINSPQILELSGIGSPSVLQKAGVDLVVDNAGVGENLNDHTATALTLVSHLLCPSEDRLTHLVRASKTSIPLRKLYFAIQSSCNKLYKLTWSTKLDLS